LSFKQDTLLKQWMDREKAAVDYGRLCDKRIAELEGRMSHLQAELEGMRAGEASRTASERQLAAATSVVRELSTEVEHLRSQRSHSQATPKTHSEHTLSQMPMLRFESVVDTAKIGLAEELRIAKKAEPTLQDSILVSDGEDLIPARWLPLKKALQALTSGAATFKVKQARN
jgi:hypothetical protein